MTAPNPSRLPRALLCAAIAVMAAAWAPPGQAVTAPASATAGKRPTVAPGAAAGRVSPQSKATAPKAAIAARPTAASKVAAAKPTIAARPAGELVDYSERADVRRFIDEMAQRNGLDADALARDFSRIRYDASIIRLMTPPTGNFKRSWAVYRTRFLDPLRIREGGRFWREHQADVRRASEQYGVPEEIIVGIIGVETIYGRITGDFRVLDALTVLSFDYPRRADFFRSELEQFLLYSRDNSIDPASVKGSFAGAIGLPQFMPGSIRRYAVDFDGDGKIDLRTSPVDAIGSVARFLAEHGWRRGEATHLQMVYDNEPRLRPLVEAGIEPRYTLGELADYGISSDAGAPQDMKLALIDLPNGDGPVTYLLGTPNFYVITRYNRSSFYAMAVIELANAIRESRGALTASQR